MGAQVRSLMNGVDVLVATPGRLLDLVQSNALRLGSVEVFVLDEADRMLDMGFIHDIRKIVAKLPAQAADPVVLGHHAGGDRRAGRQMLKDPAKVSVTPQATTVERIAQRIIHVDRGSKPKMLSDIIQQERTSTACWCSPAPSTAPTRSSAASTRTASPPKRSTATSRRTSASAC